MRNLSTGGAALTVAAGTTTPTPLSVIGRPFREFARLQAAGGILLLIATAVALIAANSPLHAGFVGFWHTPVTIGFGAYTLSKPLELWINDGLMAVFFFVVGLEIKREALVGELSSLRHAAVPLAAAAGGMIVPASIYAVFNAGGEGARGWGIPMATDIAFAIGILALAGNRAPLGLKVFLTALAIADDLGAVLVIALFYTSDIVWSALGYGALFLALMALANYSGVRRPLPYAILGAGLWVCLLTSGVHATIAGVLSALMIPARSRIDCESFVKTARGILDEIEASNPTSPSMPVNETNDAAFSALEDATEAIQTPLQRLEGILHPWVTFFIMPVFALANAGVRLDADAFGALGHPVVLGVALGLLIGKPVGILGAVFLLVKTGMGELPAGVSWQQLAGAAILAGIGFTMSLFIANLAFSGLELGVEARIGILGASLIAGITGWAVLRLSPPPAET